MLNKNQFDGKPVVNSDTPYLDEAALIADQANQKKGYIYIAGKKHYEKLSSSTGSISDYRVIGDLGTRVSSSIVTTYDLNWNNGVFVLTLTGDTTLSDINLPTGTNTKVIEMIVTGDFALTLPAYWTARPSNDSYVGTGENHFAVSCINGNSGTEKVIYSLENL